MFLGELRRIDVQRKLHIRRDAGASDQVRLKWRVTARLRMWRKLHRVRAHRRTGDRTGKVNPIRGKAK